MNAPLTTFHVFTRSTYLFDRSLPTIRQITARSSLFFSRSLIPAVGAKFCFDAQSSLHPLGCWKIGPPLVEEQIARKLTVHFWHQDALFSRCRSSPARADKRDVGFMAPGTSLCNRWGCNQEHNPEAGRKLRFCQKCKEVVYCSRDCQVFNLFYLLIK